MPTRSPDSRCLFDLASQQQGHFTTAQAKTCAYSRALLSHHARQGEFRRVRHGIYRLRNYPSSPFEEFAVEWLAAGTEASAISHSSALYLHELSDVLPDRIDVLVPRAKSGYSGGDSVRVHTTIRPFETTKRHGIRVTFPERSIVDACLWGAEPSEIRKAIEEGLQRGMITTESLRQAMPQRLSRRCRSLMEEVMEHWRDGE